MTYNKSVAAPQVSIAASPTSISASTTSTLTVVAPQATEVILNGTDGSSYKLTAGGGTQSVSPTETTTYTAVASSLGGNSSASVTVTVSPNPPPTITITASPATISVGSATALSVNAANATQVTISGTDGSSYPLTSSGGTQAVTPVGTTTYKAVATGAGGSVSASATVTVTAAQAPPTLPASVTIAANPSTVSLGNATTLSVTAANATEVTVSGSDGSSYNLSASGGMQSVSPTSTTTYTAVATGAGGSVSATATVNVTAAPTEPATVTIVANSTTISLGNASTLTVTAANATQVTIGGTDGSTYNLGATGGTQSVSPTKPATYTAVATNSGGSVSASVTITIIAATPTFAPGSGQYTSSQTVSLTSATPGAVIYYTTDGSAPTSASPKYAAPIAVSNSEAIQAIAVAPSYATSGLGRANYTITPPATGPTIPSNAASTKEIQQLPNWQMDHDSGTPGSSVGVMTLVGTPSSGGEAAQYQTSFVNWGGERYYKGYATDAAAKNFVYDAEFWIEAGSVIGNLEMDNNQVIPDGDTVIYGFQCGGDTNTWDYTVNEGTPTVPVPHWIHSGAACNPAKWSSNAWHHIQISYSRDEVGNVTYQSVWVDGVETPINETAPSAFTLGWGAGALLTNLQVDGLGAGGSSTVYVDDLTIYRW